MQEVTKVGPIIDGTEACRTLDEALIEGAHLSGITSGVGPFRFARNLGISVTEVSIRTASQSVEVLTTGCIDEDLSQQERTVAVECPDDAKDRCETCILSFEGGRVVLDALATRFDEKSPVEVF